jgi:hypothetical protein
VRRVVHCVCAGEKDVGDSPAGVELFEMGLPEAVLVVEEEMMAAEGGAVGCSPEASSLSNSGFRSPPKRVQQNAPKEIEVFCLWVDDFGTNLAKNGCGQLLCPQAMRG